MGNGWSMDVQQISPIKEYVGQFNILCLISHSIYLRLCLVQKQVKEVHICIRMVRRTAAILNTLFNRFKKTFQYLGIDTFRIEINSS